MGPSECQNAARYVGQLAQDGPKEMHDGDGSCFAPSRRLVRMVCGLGGCRTWTKKMEHDPLRMPDQLTRNPTADQCD